MSVGTTTNQLRDHRWLAYPTETLPNQQVTLLWADFYALTAHRTCLLRNDLQRAAIQGQDVELPSGVLPEAGNHASRVKRLPIGILHWFATLQAEASHPALAKVGVQVVPLKRGDPAATGMSSR